MKNKKALMAVALSAVLIVPFTVFAAASDAPAAKNIRGFFGIDASKLTDQQKADVKDFNQKMAELKKDFINKMIANGAMTQEQGDAAIKAIDDILANGGEYSLAPGFGMGKGLVKDRGVKGDFAVKGGIDTSKLSDEQKAGLMDSHKKMAELQKELIGKMVSNGLLTKEQGDNLLNKIDAMSKALEEKGVAGVKGLMMGDFGAFNCFGIDRIGQAALTEQQKADLSDYNARMDELQKEYVNKLVGYGLITSEQGDAMNKRIESKDSAGIKNGVPGQDGKGFIKNRGMGKGNCENRSFKGDGSQNNSSQNSSGAPAVNQNIKL